MRVVVPTESLCAWRREVSVCLSRMLNAFFEKLQPFTERSTALL